MRAPTCLKMEIWDNQTGELLCRETPYHGHGRDLVRDGNSTGLDKYDEDGYIAQRICLWGPPPLQPPPAVSGVLLTVPLWVVAVTNNSYGHHGEMALPQMIVTDM